MKCNECPLGNGPAVPNEGLRVVTHEVEVAGEKRTKRTQVVNNDGNFEVVVVGMAPASEEIRLKRPFIGPSGQFLRSTLHQLGIVEYYLTNVMRCPLSEDLTPKECMHYSESRVIEDVKAKNPMLTIVLGALPLHIFYDTDASIREVEGRLFIGKTGLVLPVTHPAYYLRRPEEAMDFIEVLRAGVRVLKGVYEQAQDVTHTLVTQENLQEVITEINKHDIIAVDSETTGFNAQRVNPNEIIEVGISVNDKHTYVIPKDMLMPFKDILETKKGLYWHAQFDASFLKVMGINPNIYFDGMLAHYCMDERRHSHGLKRVAQIYLGSDNWEKDLKTYIPKGEAKTFNYADIPNDVRQEYLGYDVGRTYQLYKVLAPEVKDNWPFWNILMPAARMFVDIRHDGITIDPNKVLEVKSALEEDMSNLESELHEIGGEYFNPASPKQVSNIIYHKFKMIPPDREKGCTTSKVYLEQYREDFEFIDKLIEWREAAKDVGTYLIGFAKCLDRNFRIHPTFKLFGTETGRISTENPSVMNIKRGGKSRVKEIFVASSPDRYILELDLERAELVCYALIAEDEKLLEILSKEPTPEEPRKNDPHYQVACMAYGIERADEMRVPAKAVVFGRLYGRGINSLAAQFGVDKAKKLASTVDTMLPKLKEYESNIRRQLRQYGYVESFFKRRRRFPLITKASGNIISQAINMPVQSTSSDINLLNMIYAHNNLCEKYDVRILFCVHDSIIFDIPSYDVIQPLKQELEDYAYNIVEQKVRVTYEAKVGKNWRFVEKVK